MTSTDVSNSSRPQTLRTLLIAVVAALMLTTAFAAPAFAATAPKTESGYKQKPPVPKEEKPANGTAPAKESSEPAAQGTAPEAAAASPESSTLPFTGLDLRWVIGGGLLLIGSGASIRIVQRRERQGSSR